MWTQIRSWCRDLLAGGHLAACLAMFWHTKWLAEMAGVTNDILKPAAMLLNYPVITSGDMHTGDL